MAGGSIKILFREIASYLAKKGEIYPAYQAITKRNEHKLLLVGIIHINAVPLQKIIKNNHL